MARGLFRKTSFNKIVGAYRSQWKRFWMRLFTFGAYGRKGMGWLRDPKKAWYNWLYHRTSISIPRLLGYKPSRVSLFCAMMVASVVSIFAAPVDAVRVGAKVHTIKKRIKSRETSSSPSTSTNKSKSGTTRNSTTSGTKSGSTSSTERKPKKINSRSTPSKSTRSTHSVANPTNTRKSPQKSKITYAPAKEPVKEENTEQKFIHSSESLNYEPAKPVTPTTLPDPVIEESDPNAPKSKPKHENDQHISKRMIIAGSAYCDKTALDKLTIGTYFELVAEPTNPHDKDAIMLMHNGEKIGYVAKQDNFAFVTCLRLKRKIYGVITDIIPDPSPTRYEYETWFDFGNN